MRPTACPVAASLDASLDAAILLNSEGGVLRLNPVAERLFDHSARGGAGAGGRETAPIITTHASSYLVLRQRADANGAEDAAMDEDMDIRLNGGEGAPLFWEDILDDMKMEESGFPKLLDAVALRKDDQTSFPVAVSLTRLPQCKCKECGQQQAPDGGSEGGGEVGEEEAGTCMSPRAAAFCAYLRETSRDDDGQNQHTRKLEKEVQRLRHAVAKPLSFAAIDASSEPYFLVDGDGTIAEANGAAAALYGWTRREIVGENLSAIVNVGQAPTRRHDLFVRSFLEASAAAKKSKEMKAYKRDGMEFPVEFRAVEVPRGGAAGNDPPPNGNDGTGEKSYFVFTKDLSSQSDAEGLAQAMINASLDPMFQTDEKGVILMANRAATDVFGWSTSEFLGSNIGMIASGEHYHKHETYMARYMRTGQTRVMGRMRELTATRKNGTRIPVMLGLTEIIKTDGSRAFCGHLQDLTAQKEKERITAAMIESSFDPMFQADENGIILLANKAAANTFGWESKEEFIGKNISVIMGGEDAKMHDKYMRKYMATNVKRVLGKRRQLTAKKRDGTTFQIQLGLTEVKTKSGKRTFCGFVRDLTEQELYEKRIQRKQDLVEGMIDSAFDPMFLIDKNGIIQMTNRAAVDHFGWEQTEMIGQNISMICGGPHAGPRHDEYIRRYLQTGEKRVINRRRQVLAKRKDGTEFPCELGMREVLTAMNERMFCGFIRDVTREKYDETEIAERERLTSTIVESTPDPLFTIDEHGTIYRVNAAVKHQFGWEREDLLERSITTIMSGKYAAQYCAAGNMERYIVGSVGRATQVDAVRRDGSEIPILLMVFEVPGPFPILLPQVSDGDGKDQSPSRLFVAFARIPTQQSGASNQFMAFSSFLGSLRDESVPCEQ